MASVELQAVIDQLRAHPIDPNAPLEVLRAAFPAAPAPEGTIITPIDAGGMPAEWVVADTAAPDRRLLYLHGGGYVICSPATHRDLAGRISKAAGVSVLVLDYRLAPEPRRSSAASCPLNRAVPGHGHDLLAAPGQGGTGTGGWAVMDL